MTQTYNFKVKFLAHLKERVASSKYKAALSSNKELILLYHHIGAQILAIEELEAELAKDLGSEDE